MSSSQPASTPTAGTPAPAPGRGGLRLRGWPLAFTVGAYLAWISAGHLPLREAWVGLLAPTDFTRDFIAAKVLLRGEPISELDGARGNAEAIRAGAKPVHIIDGSPFHLHPPPAALPMLPLVPLGFRPASAVWLALSLALLARLAWLLSRLRTGAWPPAPLLFVLLALWPPVLTNLELGQWSIILATLIAEGHRLWERGRRTSGAATLGVAAALKLTPFVLLPFVAARSRRGSLAFVGVVAAAIAAAFPFGRLDPWIALFSQSRLNTIRWQTFWHNTLSLNGLLSRELVGGRFATPIVEAPRLAQALLAAGSAALVLLAWVSGRPGRPATAAGETAREGCRFALWVVLVVVLNPLAWYHYAILLLLPAALVLRAASGEEVPPDRRRALQGCVAGALIALTVPKEALFLAVAPLPSRPLASLVLSLHFCAALALFAAAALAATRPRA